MGICSPDFIFAIYSKFGFCFFNRFKIKMFFFVTLYKMNPKNIDITNISTRTPKLINKESHRYCIIPIEMTSSGKIGSLSLKFEARMKIFKHSSSGNDSYSLGISIPDELVEKFESFEKRINDLALLRKNEVRNLNLNFGNFHQGDFHLIKEDKSGNPKIYAKLYVDKVQPLNSSAIFYRLVDEKKKEKIKNNLELEGVPLDGIVVVSLKQLFCGNLRALTCVVQEVLVKEEIHPQSAFDEYEDED